MLIDNLEKILEGEPKFRRKQIFQAVFLDLIEDWNACSVLPKNLRHKLEKECPLEILGEMKSSQKSDSQKVLIRISEIESVEAVLLRHADGRNTVCVSSQAGCPMGCAFCESGKIENKRNLTAGEIVAQVLFFERMLKKRENKKVSNVVFMGIGEPFLNYDNVMAAARIFNGKDGLNIGARHISISTCGIVPAIEKFASEPEQFNLAVSLHAPSQALREKLMPIAKKYPLKDLLAAIRKYVQKTSRQVMLEYLLLEGVNDNQENALELAKIAKNRLFVVNLIRYNPTGIFQPSSAERIKNFKNILEKEGIKVTQRYAFGGDIAGACGQLSGSGEH